MIPPITRRDKSINPVSTKKTRADFLCQITGKICMGSTNPSQIQRDVNMASPTEVTWREASKKARK
jgi:hypothetical protein